MLYTSHGGYAVRPDSELLQIMAIPIKVRKDMVQRMANYHQGVYTVQQLLDWYNSQPLSDRVFEWALTQWKQEFPMAPKTRLRIETLKEENTRESKKRRENC